MNKTELMVLMMFTSTIGLFSFTELVVIGGPVDSLTFACLLELPSILLSFLL
jgi:hypothetical protein